VTSVLITGGAGFVGSNLVRHWVTNNPDDTVTVLDALTYARRRENLEGVAECQFVHGDIRDEPVVADLVRSREIDTIIHLAAESHVDRSIGGPDAFVEANIVGTHALLKVAKSIWLDQGTGIPHRFHHVSTDEIFRSLQEDAPRFSENSSCAPNSPYAASKAASNHLVRAYAQTYGLQTSISNCSNNYGPYQFPEKLIPRFLINALNGKPLPIYGDGRQIRDWIHVEDHCRAIDLIAKSGLAGESYNVGGGCELRNRDIAEMLCLQLDADFQQSPDLRKRFNGAPGAKGIPTSSLIQKVADRPGHDQRYAIDDTKIRRELGFSLSRDFSSGFRATLTWYLENEKWWRSII